MHVYYSWYGKLTKLEYINLKLTFALNLCKLLNIHQLLLGPHPMTN